MENKIVTAIFKDSTRTKVSDVWQYDYGQILRIQGLDLPTAVEVDFAVAGASESIARIGTTKDGVTDVVIPDSLIETGNNLVAYIYLRDSASGNTEYQIDMLVTKRAKPEAYDTPEDKELFGQAIEAVNAAADRAEKAGQTAQEAAQKAGLDAEQTAQDRVEVAKMVETVTDISEQVKKVEELSNKAQESATQAGTSATAAEKAKAQAETAVGKTAEDRTAVNQVKIAVDEVQEAVRADRAAVEEVKQSVEQLSNAIPESTQVGVQAVNQAKQTAVDEIARTGISHKTAVEGAGTQAVENVENVKQTATIAVETVKTEAVQSVQTEGTKQTGNVSAEGAKQIKEVQDKGAEVLQSIPEDFATQMETKLNKQQGIENKGKALVIGEDGNVVPGEVSSGGGDGIAIINTMSGESPLAIPDSAERVNKGLELGGKTTQMSTRGVNLWNKESKITFTATKQVVFDTPIPAGDYVVSANVTSNDKDGTVCLMLFYYTDSGSKGANLTRAGRASAKITFTSDVKHVVLYAGQNANGSANDTATFADIQLEKGSTATAYEPYTGGKPSPSQEYQQEIKNVGKWNEETQKYEVDVKITNAEQNWSKEQTLTLTSDRPLTKWDRLVEQGGEYGWLYGSVIATIDETADISLYAPNGFFIHVKNIDKKEKTGYCDKLYAKKMSNGEPFVLFGNANNNGLYTLNTQEFYGKTVSEIREKLKEYPLNIIGKSETTEFVPLPQSEQNAIRALKTYYPTTVITADGGELDPDIKVTYTADTKNYIDGKVSANVASIISQYQLNTANLLSLMPMETQATMIENDTNRILENVEEMKYE